MSAIVVPTVLLWLLIGLFAANAAASLYKLWLMHKLTGKTAGQRFRAWRERTGFFMDGHDGGM